MIPRRSELVTSQGFPEGPLPCLQHLTDAEMTVRLGLCAPNQIGVFSPDVPTVYNLCLVNTLSF